jgi:citronellol/citronellal dehydrogenase
MKGKTIIITGASRGIGLAIAVRCARAGANVAIVTKDSPESLQSAADQIERAGGKSLVLSVDVTDTIAIQQAITQTAAHFGGIDALVNNTSAAWLTDTSHTSPEKFDLTVATSVRAAFFMSKGCLPYLKQANNPHIINISPPLYIDPQCLKNYLAFALSKYAMSFCTLGMAEEFKHSGIAVNSLWPESTIATQTIKDHFLPEVFSASRWPAIMGEAAYHLLQRSSRECSGQFFTDEILLKEVGVTDFSQYAVEPGTLLKQSLFLPPSNHTTPISTELFRAKS